MLPKLREDAATTAARFVYPGAHTGLEGIDQAKQNRGCKPISRRTHLSLNSLTSVALNWFKPHDLSELWGRSAEAVPLGKGESGDPRGSPGEFES